MYNPFYTYGGIGTGSLSSDVYDDLEQTPAKIGYFFEFREEFAQPLVDVQSSKQTVTHETIGDESVTQVIGDKADQLTINGVVTDDQLDQVDYLTETTIQPLSVRTERWSGDAVVKTVSTTPRNEIWEGHWLYDVTIDLVESNRTD